MSVIGTFETSTAVVNFRDHGFSSVMIIVQDFTVSPLVRSFHSSHNPANEIT